MKTEWQGLLRAPLSGEPLTYQGSYQGEKKADWAEGWVSTPRGLAVATVKDGVLDFVQMPTWESLDMAKVRAEKWIERGWKSQQAMGREQAFKDVATDIFSAGPMIVETGGVWMMVPGLVSGWPALVESVGFVIEKDRVLVRKVLTQEDCDLGRLAHRYGAAVESEFHYIVRGLVAGVTEPGALRM